MSNYIDLCKGRAFIHNRSVVLHENIHIHHRERDVHVKAKVPQILAKPLGKQKVKLSDNLT